MIEAEGWDGLRPPPPMWISSDPTGGILLPPMGVGVVSGFPLRQSSAHRSLTMVKIRFGRSSLCYSRHRTVLFLLWCMATGGTSWTIARPERLLRRASVLSPILVGESGQDWHSSALLQPLGKGDHRDLGPGECPSARRSHGRNGMRPRSPRTSGEPYSPSPCRLSGRLGMGLVFAFLLIPSMGLTSVFSSAHSLKVSIVHIPDISPRAFREGKLSFPGGYTS